jgi:hypothetical protein
MLSYKIYRSNFQGESRDALKDFTTNVPEAPRAGRGTTYVYK